MTAERRRGLLILGMHRSGTSALAGLMKIAGFDLGERFLPAVDGVNPKGFWEHARVVDVHERLLASLGFTWHDVRKLPADWWRRPEVEPFRKELVAIVQSDFAQSPLWALKDPRLCRLLPLWREVLQITACAGSAVVILRDPREVAESVAKAHRFEPDHGYLLWMRHVLEAERHTRDWPRIFVKYEDVISDHRAMLARICDGLSLGPPTGTDFHREAREFLEPGLRHHVAHDEAPGPVGEQALVIYRAMTRAPSWARLAEAVQPTGAEVDAMEAGAELAQELSDTRYALERSRDETRAALAEIRRAKGTVSWRITGPLRASWNYLMRLRGVGQQR